ncbi:sulfurtransferase complex subunit TusD [Buchnera aphidicola]|uniref:Uncharacterized conserved protein n=2 Tax=Buchnera aphidicola (Cinara cedri) TaxID=261318 RepID=Q056Z6_BUCCC|nr:sulfurtransferase complex subunit TusD [Buchnera aphidicola]AAW72715.1 conserved hypothetical protein [Buchnera aphidicola (Cinara cedri)]ABJ90803.1 uncharacterized conserved protein [Buchnera aphidicola BCc]
MNYLIFVCAPPYSMQNSITAYMFAKSLFLLNYRVKKVFFYASGIYNANCMIPTEENEFNILNEWINLKKKYNFKLCVCPSAAYKRGLLSNTHTSTLKLGYKYNFFSSSFQWMSLSELSYSIHDYDRIIQF